MYNLTTDLFLNTETFMRQVVKSRGPAARGLSFYNLEHAPYRVFAASQTPLAVLFLWELLSIPRLEMRMSGAKFYCKIYVV